MGHLSRASCVVKMGNDHSGPYLERQLSQTSGKDAAAIQSMYSEFQKDCPSGYLTPRKFTELYARVSNSEAGDDFRAKAFSQFDRRNNGTINFRDFLMVVHVSSNGSAEDKLRTMFSLYDQDGNGSIDAAEMDSVIRDIYNMMDKDKDGKITEQEFIRASLEDADLVRML